MTPERWQKVSAVLDQVLDLDKGERATFLEELHCQDPGLCEEIKSLLAQHETAEHLETPPTELLAGLEPTLVPSTPVLPKQLGDYRIKGILGAGGMGVVYEAEDPTLERRVALKVMKQEYADQPDARARFLREARAVAAFQHDHILHVYHVAEEKGVVFLVMPLLLGETLEDRLKSEPNLPLPQILRIGREIAEGLAAAHARGLTHRDIKPANLWLEAGKDRIKIMDFGLVRPAQTDGHVTSSGVILGTPAYMAPEQGRGEEVDGRADLFSLGCLMYRLCTGTVPFLKKDVISTLVAAASEPAIPPSERNRSIPKPVSDLIVKLLAKAPAERPQSALEVVNRITALEQALARSPIAGAAAAWPKMRRWALGLAALLITLAVCAIFFPWRPEKRNREIPDAKEPARPVISSIALPWRDWLAGKTSDQILTVSQDGSGMFNTIGAAINALKPGQVVKLLDKGPYQEDLDNKVLPPDVGLISEVGTRLELPHWHLSHPLQKGVFYRGLNLAVTEGARLVGLEISAPELPTDSMYAALLMVPIRGEVILESCRLLHRPPYSLEAPASSLPGSMFTALHINGPPAENNRLSVRRTLLEGTIVFANDSPAPRSCVIEENHILGWRFGGIILDSTAPGSVLIRHNVIHSQANSIDVTARWHNSGFPLALVNNLFDQPFQPLAFGPYDAAEIKQRGTLLIPSQVRFENNIVSSAYTRGIGLLAQGHELAGKSWRLGHNCYLAEPVGPQDLAKQPNDLVRQRPFLSDDPKDVTHFRRIDVTSPLASAGAGGDLPTFIGPFPPGPAPKEGDWFTRLLSAP